MAKVQCRRANPLEGRHAAMVFTPSTDNHCERRPCSNITWHDMSWDAVFAASKASLHVAAKEIPGDVDEPEPPSLPLEVTSLLVSLPHRSSDSSHPATGTASSTINMAHFNTSSVDTTSTPALIPKDDEGKQSLGRRCPVRCELPRLLPVEEKEWE